MIGSSPRQAALLQKAINQRARTVSSAAPDEDKQMLGASFFCSRASDETSNARLIAPTIAHALCIASPGIRSHVLKAIMDDSALAEPTYIKLADQFNKLIYFPTRRLTGTSLPYKIIILDALDECRDLNIVHSLIRLIFASSSDLPLKVFISSRDEYLIRRAFEEQWAHGPRAFYLHEVDKAVVADDISRYIKASLGDIHERYRTHSLDMWPSEDEVSRLVDQSGTFFIYAATAVRYIMDGGPPYQRRLSFMANQVSRLDGKKISVIDRLYGHILRQLCAALEESEVDDIKGVLSMIIFLRNPLSIGAVSLLYGGNATILQAYLSHLTSLIHIPSNPLNPITPFHASFPDFATDTSRGGLLNVQSDRHTCPEFTALDISEGHELLLVKCLQCMNDSLKYNICDVPVEFRTLPVNPGEISDNYGHQINEALKYSCVHWAHHLENTENPRPSLMSALDNFLRRHLLHWLEALGWINGLHSGLDCLAVAVSALTLLVEDARRFLQKNFDLISQYGSEIYRSALVWIPETSPMRKVYINPTDNFPKIVAGLPFEGPWAFILPTSWDLQELVMHTESPIQAVAFSPNAQQVVAGSDDGLLRLWNAQTGAAENTIQAHLGPILSIEFANSGARIVSSSADSTIKICDAVTGSLEATLLGHTDAVNSVKFSPNDTQVVSASSDKTVKIWDANSGTLVIELKYHTSAVLAAIFSPDSSRVFSASEDGACIWIYHMLSGELETIIPYPGNHITALSFSHDSRRLAFAASPLSFLPSPRILAIHTGGTSTEPESAAHRLRPGPGSAIVNCLAFSPDGTLLASGGKSWVKAWNTKTGQLWSVTDQVQNVLSVSFSQENSRIVVGSTDGVRIWNHDPDKDSKSEGAIRGRRVDWNCLVFSPDGGWLAGISNQNSVKLWNATTGQPIALSLASSSFVRDLERIEPILRIEGVAFSRNGERLLGVVLDPGWSKGWPITQHWPSAPKPASICIWNTTTGKLEAELQNQSELVSAAFFQDFGRVAFASKQPKKDDVESYRIFIWDSTTGAAVLEASFVPRLPKPNPHTVPFPAPKLEDVVLAISRDDTHVVLKLGQDVAIRNVETGTSFLASTPLTLPDSGKIPKAESGSASEKFRIIYEDNDRLQLSNAWVVGSNSRCWIPPHERDFTKSAVSKTKACFAYASGRVVILDMGGEQD
ncbi:hypothetical protein FB45DRAFT_826046 [Roridomyces roridus]|uniref:Nephrocystin 3-like N-terminal domain-containing protein n=1 Tax=Roridomyces roridus TaxID=1738132 RepID=A0AAD7CA97_9AGAR|nr:hypothetical protein FB45DRAFT_826046 [Roridomyces roridus]